MSIELRHLRYVILAAEHGSFRRAAAALGIRPSAVSRRIHDLEDELGSALFIRQNSGVALTYAGEQFVQRARKAINQVGYAAKDVAAIGRGENGVVRVGLFSSLASTFLTELFRSYDVGHKEVRLDFIEGSPDQHISKIRQHRLDVAFLVGPVKADDCDIAHLWDERVYVALPLSDALASRDEIHWADLRDRHFVVSEAAPGPEVHDYLVNHLVESGHRPSIQHHDVYRDVLMNIVAAGRGVTLTSEATIATQFPGVIFRPLAGEILPYWAIWSPRNDNPALRRLLSLAKTISKRRAA